MGVDEKKMRLAWYVRRLLEKIGMSEWKAFGYEIKIGKFEDWLQRRPITMAMILIDPKDCMNEYKRMSASFDSFELKHVSGLWQKHFTWVAKAEVVKE